jgi:hypothetical protein
MAAGGAARARGSKEEATFLKLQLEVVDRLAKLTGAYAPETSSRPGQTNVAIQINTVHEIDNLPPAELAKRLQMWASEVTDSLKIIEGTATEDDSDGQ